MRVLIDSNVFISYLLKVSSGGTIDEIFDGLAQAAFVLLLPAALLTEIVTTVRTRPHLSTRISSAVLTEFVTLLTSLGETIPRITAPIPQVTRDPKDDYLLAYALVGRADYLVTGDRDLLVLNERVPELEILTPGQFVDRLSQRR